MTLTTVIFDLGGTLIEYAGPYATWPNLETPGLQAAYASLQSRGVTLPAFAALRDTYFDLLPGRWETAVTGQQNLRLADLLGELLHVCCGKNGIQPGWLVEAAELYQHAICAQAHPLDGAKETLEAVKAQGYKLGLLSNTMFTGAAHMADLRRFGLDGYFDAMLFSADVNMWKPQAAPYLQLVKELGDGVDTAVFIGDSPEHDIAGAHNAGLRAILIQSTQRFPVPDHIHPDAIIRELAELPSVLGKVFAG
ncbi:MAG: HAD family hydrolase [Ardenticatenaceae bacterium]|nr:HAD family hydrolase [Anaerolineales bacterium]MCB8923261.1 HAD family hydrolase [Ardenticatenaceae bacterium]